MTRVVIIGGGFAGAVVAKQLARHKNFAVTLVDQRDHFLLFALLVDVVSDPTFPAERLSSNFKAMAKHFGYTFVQGNVTKVDRDHRVVHLADGRGLGYDFLVLAMGSRPNYFGIPGAEQYCVPYRSYADARRLSLRAGGLKSLEHIVVIGGGPTGVELAGSLRQRVGSNGPRVVLVQALPQILPDHDVRLRRLAIKYLERAGVEILVDAPVVEVTPKEVILKSGQRLPASLTVWAGGIQPNQLVVTPALPQDDHGYLQTDDHLSLTSNIFAGGDCMNSQNPTIATPNTSQHAREEGVCIADNILAAHANQPMRPFSYQTRGTLLRLGRLSILDLNFIRLHGRYVTFLGDLLYRQRLGEVIGKWLA